MDDPEIEEERSAILEKLRGQRATLLEQISEATRFVVETEEQIAELECYEKSCRNGERRWLFGARADLHPPPRDMRGTP